MLKKPGVNSTEGKKSLGAYGLIVLLVGNVFLPNAQMEDFQGIVNWMIVNEVTPEKIYNWVFSGGLVAHLANWLRIKK